MHPVREQDGIHFDLEQRIVADGRSASGDINVVTHAHSDHAPQSDRENVLCSPLTADLIQERNGITVDAMYAHEDVELLPSGHILGSRAAWLFDDGTSYLYTGDVCTRDRCYMEGFDPVPADVLILETTYGVPAYTFPDHSEVEAQIRDWIDDNTDCPLFLFGYSLGRAQKIQHIVQDSTNRRITVSDTIHAMNEAIADASDLSFRAEPYNEKTDLVVNGDDIVVLPTRLAKTDWVQDTVTRTGAKTAGFSGWASQDGYAQRNGYDAAFPLSDHCDFEELVELVKSVDPDKVYTHHGFDEAFASFLRNDYGYRARALHQRQATLDEF